MTLQSSRTDFELALGKVALQNSGTICSDGVCSRCGECTRNLGFRVYGPPWLYFISAMDDGTLHGKGRHSAHLFNSSVSLPPSITSAINKLQTSGSDNGGKDWKRPLLATVVPPCAASVSFLCSLAVAQGAGKLLRVSCATPVVAPIVGGLAVAAASATAAQVSFTVRRICESDGRLEKLELISREKALFYAVFGLVAYKVLGGRVRNVMPSNVIRPGAHAHSSIPARGVRYANDVESGLIKDLFKRYGCHHCGQRRGSAIADHMPANMVAKEAMAGNFFTRLLGKQILVQQRLYPQCLSCSKLQSSALRHGKHRLVFHYHRGLPQPPAWTGFCIGALQIQEDDHPYFSNSYRR